MATARTIRCANVAGRPASRSLWSDAFAWVMSILLCTRPPGTSAIRRASDIHLSAAERASKRSEGEESELTTRPPPFYSPAGGGNDAARGLAGRGASLDGAAR